MRKFFILSGLFFIIFFSYSAYAENEKTDQEIQAEFSQWVIDFKKIAQEKHKISTKILDKAFEAFEYKAKVIKLDRSQPEFVKTFWDYYKDALHPLRIKRGKAKLKENEKILKKVEKKYKVPANIIVAFWGVETDYGRNMGNSSIINVLTTLSFDHRRSKFFTEELIYTLKIAQSGKMNLDDLKGSWAGAFGNFQFLPSTYTKYAVDCDKDGKIDIRNSLYDSFCSAANYLSKIGWNNNRWGRPVKFNKANKKIWSYVNSKEWHSVAFFSKLGVVKLNGSKLPNTKVKARLIANAGVDGPVFLVYKNFQKILQWNNSTNYALSVGLLSDAIVDNEIGDIKANDIKQ